MRVAALVPLILIPASLEAQDFTAPRNATVPVSNARRIEVIARAGTLRIDGRSGTRDVTVRGTARASNRRALDEVQLIAEERDGTIHIEADIPENRDWDDDHQSLDLTITVPRDLPIEVSDGSGELEIQNVGPLVLRDGSGEATIEHVGGNLRVKDGSGSLHIVDVNGDVDVTDGSGELEIRDVRGGVEIAGKGSGSLRITNVDRSVHIGSKGSGSVDVNHVGGDFVVERKSSGDIDYSDVKGKVDLPERRRRGRSELR
jgi:hypothetical protein